MIAKKRAWQATPVDNAPVKEGAEDTLFRALALRHLELPVKDLLEQGLQRDLPATPGVIEALQSNQKDEERHDEALNYVASAYGTNAKPESENDDAHREKDRPADLLGGHQRSLPSFGGSEWPPLFLLLALAVPDDVFGDHDRGVHQHADGDGYSR